MCEAVPVARTLPVAEGITNPPIDDLLTKTDSKYKLVLYSAKRARQINAYYSQLGEGLLEYVGPLVDTHVQEKPLSIALREINDDLLTCNDVHRVPHVRIGQDADLVVVAPATADLLAKAAHGLADDLLTSTLLTARCPVVFAPAMHTEMWEHPATRENVATLRRRGSLVIEPAVGRLTGVDTGKVRLPDPTEIYAICRRVLSRGVTEPALKGRHVVVSAGGTRE